MVKAAVDVLQTGRRLEALPATRRSFAAGELSLQQAAEITAAAEANPRTEQALLQAAQTESVKALRQHCRSIIAASVRDQDDADKRLYERRYLRSWTDADGSIRLDARLAPDAGARLLAPIEARASELFAQDRRAGSRERREAYAVDALVSLVAGGGGGTSAVVHVHVDYQAYLRGRLAEGEHCEIPGIGPIPVAAARRLAEDAVIKAVLDDGADVRAIATVGRPIPAPVKAAVTARDKTCAWPGCDEHRGLELHHLVPIYQGGLSTVDNVCRSCNWHHKLITHHGWRLKGPPGKWRIIPPGRRERPGTRPRDG